MAETYFDAAKAISTFNRFEMAPRTETLLALYNEASRDTETRFMRDALAEIARLRELAINLDYAYHGHPVDERWHRGDCTICATMRGEY